MRVEGGDDLLDINDGLLYLFRTIACFCIIALHTNIYSRFANGSIAELQALMTSSSIVMRALLYGIVSVDSFFVISGFLLVYNFLNNKALRQDIQEASYSVNIRKFMRYGMNRYLRYII